MSTITFPTPESLAEWLKLRIPEEKLKTWGVEPGTKNIHNLWLEVKEGESVLNESSPLRTVHCVVVRINGPNNTILVECFQEMSNGTIRRRYRDLSQKLKADQKNNVVAAALRAVKAELGSVLPLDVKRIEEVVRIIPGSHGVIQNEEKSCDSYPGLSTRYVVNIVAAYVEGLPKNNFFTVEDEYAEFGDAMAAKLVTVKKHYWMWDVDPMLR